MINIAPLTFQRESIDFTLLSLYYFFFLILQANVNFNIIIKRLFY